jgi:hypothetical protein
MPLLVAAVAAPSLVVFVLPMVELIARNDEYFGGSYLLGRAIYGAGLACAAVGVGAWALSGRTVGRFAWTGYLLAAPAFVVASFFGGLRTAATALAVGFVVVVGAAVLTWLGSARSIRTLAVVSAVVLAGALVSTVAGVVTAGTADTATGGAEPSGAGPAGAAPPNVYHVVLDEMQTELFDQVLDGERRTALAGFTAYPDARTPYGRTEMSMASLFAGSDYAFDRSPSEFVEDALHGPSSGLQRLRDAGYEVSGDVPAANVYGERLPFDHVQLPAAQDAASSAGDAGLATSMWVYQNTPESLSVRVLPRRYFEQLEGGNLLPDTAPPRAVEAFEAFLDREPSQAGSGRYSLVHVLLPHFPYVLDEDCSHREGEETGPVAQATCAMDLVDRLVAELKELGRFDDSTIIVQGDHGARFGVEDGSLVPLKEEVFGEPYSAARSRALLLVKPAGTTDAQPFAEDDYPAMLTDVVPTILDSVGAPLASAGDRTSLLADDRPVRTSRRYFFYDKDSHGLPDGRVTGYVVHEDGSVTRDEVVELPG